METCILMPPELSLILLPHPDPAKIFEMSVTLWSNCTLRPGKVFRPDDGKMTLDKLEVYGVLPLKDTRYMFGCTDAIIEVDDREVRHCNWVRFLRVAQNPDDVNIIGSRVQGQFVFQVIKTIPPNGELKAYLDIGPKIHGKSKIIRHITIRGNNEKENLLISPTGSTSTHSTSGSPQSDDFDDDRRSTPSSDISPSTTTTTNTSKSKVSESDFLSTPGGKGGKSTDNFLSASGSSPFTSPPFPDGKRFCHSPIIGSGPGYQVPLLALPEYKDARVTPLRRKEKTWLPCEVCGKKFDRPSLLKRHMRTHTGEKPHACDVCGKAFSTSSSLNTHRRIHSGEKPHQCQVCGKRFTASSNLYYHRMTHKKEKPHKCSMCSKSFPTPGDLKSHMYIHNGSWPFKCDVCNRGFSKQTNLKNHLLLHTGDKPHECELCGKKFALQCNLRTHVKTHEDEPRDNCIRCKRKFLSHWGHQSTCSDCMTSSDPQTPTANSGRPSNSFSIESLVSPRTESRDKRMDYAHAQSTPIDLSKTPFYANAMMTSGLVPMYRHHFDGTATAAHFTMATNWPRPPPQITQRYGM